MGMAMELFTVRDATLQRLLDDPPLVWKLSSPDEPEMYDIWNRDPKEDDTLSYLLENLAELRAAVSESARRQHGLVLVLR